MGRTCESLNLRARGCLSHRLKNLQDGAGHRPAGGSPGRPVQCCLRLTLPTGTHYLRGVNNARQPWHSTEGRLQYGLRPANPTEEGLASLHSVLFRKQPFLWRAALLYYTIHRAARMSFRQLFQDLACYVQDADVRWEYCVRAKRGQTDTSLPGGCPHVGVAGCEGSKGRASGLGAQSSPLPTGCFSKDQVYLDGIVHILRHRRTIDFPLLTSLGKVRGLQRSQLALPINAVSIP